MSAQASPPHLALLAGLLCDATIWRETADLLAGTARTRSFAFPGFTTIGDMAEHVLGAMPQNFAVAGHSMGGRVALEIVRRAPKRVTAIALLNTGVHPLAAGEPASRGELVTLAREQGMAALAARWLPPMMGADPDRIAALMPALTAMVERNTPESFAGQIQALINRPDGEAALQTVRVPLLLVCAENDRWSPPAQHHAMRERATHADLVEIQNAGHMAPAERPAAVAAALRGWLSSIGPAA